MEPRDGVAVGVRAALHWPLLAGVDPSPPPPPDQPRLLEEVVCGYGVRASTVARIAELGFTSSTLLAMTEAELDEMMAALAHLFRWDLLFGERFGLRAALRAERHRLLFAAGRPPAEAAATSQDVLSAVVNKKRAAKKARRGCAVSDGEDEEEDEAEMSDGEGGGAVMAAAPRQREHPFVVTEPGEVARAKKNGLDYLFHLYEQCRVFLLQVQAMAKMQGQKCPTKVTNQVFRYAHEAGASNINKPKMRHYVHCYALHCLDEAASDDLRRAFKARGENVGAWRQACYQPLVAIAARRGWDIDAVFADHPKLAVWYVPAKLRQLCHAARSAAAAAAAEGGCPASGGVLSVLF